MHLSLNVFWFLACIKDDNINILIFSTQIQNYSFLNSPFQIILSYYGIYFICVTQDILWNSFWLGIHFEEQPRLELTEIHMPNAGIKGLCHLLTKICFLIISNPLLMTKWLYMIRNILVSSRIQYLKYFIYLNINNKVVIIYVLSHKIKFRH